MIRHSHLVITLLVFFSALFSTPGFANSNLAPEQRTVEDFQKIPEHWPFCSDSRWEIDSKAGGVIHEMRRYLSTDMMKLFLWIQCDDPQYLNPTARERDFSWDFRYGTKRGGGALESIKIIQVDTPKPVTPNKTIVVVNYENGPYKNLWTRYTLIRENGQWKIDDIALKGYSTKMEELVPGSKSLKTELQAAYRRAEAKYKKDKRALKSQQ